MSIQRILVLNGPNLSMLGIREPEIYGTNTLEALEEGVRAYGRQRGVEVVCFQSNSEGELIDTIQNARLDYDAIVYNPGAHTHYSYALRDAVAAISIPVVEVHLSDISDREAFRRISVIAPECIAQIKGLGFEGYNRALDLLCSGKRYERLGEGYDSHDTEEELGLGLMQAVPFSEAHAPRGNEARAGGTVDDSLKGHMVVGREIGDFTETEAVPLVEFGSEPENEEIAPRDDEQAGALSLDRQNRVREACASLGIGALIVRDTSNIRWATAFDGVFDDERAHALLLADGCAYLHTDSRYSNAMRTAAGRIGSAVTIDDERVSHVQFAYNVMEREGLAAAGAKLGIEDTITYAEFVKMVERFTASRLAPTTEVVLSLRAVKDGGEIARLKAAQSVTDAAFAHIIGFMRPGMTEREVQLELEDYMMRHGGEALAFRSIVATGPNGADPHAVPGDTRLEAGQCVVMDFGAKAYGYCSDMTRTVFLGAPEGLMASAWETLRRANEEVEALLKPGVTGAEAHLHAEHVLEEGGFGGKMGHGLGHGVGIDVHELPVLNPRNTDPLVEGNVVTVEPGIYLPGQFGMRLEDFGIVTADGFEVFTQSSHDMVVI